MLTEYFLGNEESLDLGACLTWQHVENTCSGFFFFKSAFLPVISGVVGFFSCEFSRINLLCFAAEHDRRRKYH